MKLAQWKRKRSKAKPYLTRQAIHVQISMANYASRLPPCQLIYAIAVVASTNSFKCCGVWASSLINAWIPPSALGSWYEDNMKMSFAYAHLPPEYLPLHTAPHLLVEASVMIVKSTGGCIVVLLCWGPPHFRAIPLVLVSRAKSGLAMIVCVSPCFQLGKGNTSPSWWENLNSPVVFVSDWRFWCAPCCHNMFQKSRESSRSWWESDRNALKFLDLALKFRP